MSSSDTDEIIGDLDDMHENDNIPNQDNTTQLNSLLNSILPTDSSTDNSISSSVQSAFRDSSWSSSHPIISSSVFDDNIRSYVEASASFKSSKNEPSYYLSIDHTLKQSNSNPLASDKLCIININYVATEQQLKQFFMNLGFNVIHIDLPNKNKRVSLMFLFIRFQITFDVIYSLAMVVLLLFVLARWQLPRMS